MGQELCPPLSPSGRKQPPFGDYNNNVVVVPEGQQLSPLVAQRAYPLWLPRGHDKERTVGGLFAPRRGQQLRCCSPPGMNGGLPKGDATLVPPERGTPLRFCVAPKGRQAVAFALPSPYGLYPLRGYKLPQRGKTGGGKGWGNYGLYPLRFCVFPLRGKKRTKGEAKYKRRVPVVYPL